MEVRGRCPRNLHMIFGANLSLRAEISHQILTLIFKPSQSWKVMSSVFFPAFSLISKHFSLMYLFFTTMVVKLNWRAVLRMGYKTVFTVTSFGVSMFPCFMLFVSYPTLLSFISINLFWGMMKLLGEKKKVLCIQISTI